MPVSSPSAVRGYQIGEAARQSGVSTANIRFYEKENLLSPQGRGDNSYRLYSEGDVHQLRFIRLCRAMDMSLDEVRTLLGLDLNNKTDCAAARDALDGHLGHVRARLTELKALEKDLKALRNRCDGSDTHCHIIEALHELADAQVSTPSRPAPKKRHV
ncbi:Cd(II)/Pb(II)-responsive transcriptional regulator [Polaromonas sp. A23]|uniref:Cd(II)/Pb(II)-responsive transcriptional regulator n=1 Tax=Polaromonas sp. A23 TaxID=1944133 RepID=UPI0009876283|nr:Cd(II)/Pb(II)-responsive transcriptional regulator [Polaromonas sp. A23]OOG46381.1 MerR family transcriptional regulator [Polaromonas sp. A23]